MKGTFLSTGFVIVTVLASLLVENDAAVVLGDARRLHAMRGQLRHKRQETTSLPSSVLFDQDKTTLLELHQQLREEAGANAGNMLKIQYGEDLANLAQKTADTCKFDYANLNFPDNGTDVGQIIFRSDSTALPSEPLLAIFNDEKNSYTYETNTCAENKTCSNYKQIIWYNTNYVGCGKKFCGVLLLPDNEIAFSSWMWVCNYMEVGGFEDEHPYLASDEPCSYCNLDPATICERNQCRVCDPAVDAQCRVFNDTVCVTDKDSCCNTWDYDTYCKPGTEYFPYMKENCGAFCEIYLCGTV
ncbi:cysteine-rich secretory protein 2-like [Liolophura sinensis]|uniref:cysteine-rich secretory protein 2-like n=1 Tax=Liolophura sinensis TaxID=3198878 RepID=UPI00315863E0